MLVAVTHVGPGLRRLGQGPLLHLPAVWHSTNPYPGGSQAGVGGSVLGSPRVWVRLGLWGPQAPSLRVWGGAENLHFWQVQGAAAVLV